jgi:hypothetical protein
MSFPALDAAAANIPPRVLAAMTAALPDAFAEGPRRRRTAIADAFSLLGELAQSDPALGALAGELAALAADDRRLAFLDVIPEGPASGMVRALALESTLFGCRSREVAELALLVAIFTLLLDGLLDEAPDELAPVAPWLRRVMLDQEWVEGGAAAIPPVVEGCHPLSSLLQRVTIEVVRRVTSSAGWADRVVREQFSAAARAAFETELVSVDLPIRSGTLDVDAVRAAVVAKSTRCIWAGALVPFCVHGWKAGVDPDGFARLAFAVGELGGWLDDAVDVIEDLSGDRWSAVLLLCRELGASFAPGHAADVQLAEGLRSPLAATLVADGAVSRLAAVRAALHELRADDGPVLDALADMAAICLTDVRDVAGVS